MRLRELRVRRLPGIETPFTLPAAPGVNLIVGPNGSGKSSLCRAVRALLWPGREAYEPLDVAAIWEAQGGVVRASRQGRGEVRWERAGLPVSPPTVPGDQLARAYRLEIVDLLKNVPGATDRELAEEIRSRMAGGFNLDRIAREHYADQPRQGRKQQREWIAAAKRVRRLRRDQQELAGEEDELQTLRGELDQARRAASRLPFWRASRALAETEEQLATNAARLDAYPALLDDMTGDERRQLDEIAEQEQRQQNDLARQQTRIADAERKLAAASLPDGPPTDAELEAWQQRDRVARDLHGELGRAETELAQRRAELASVGETLVAAWTEAAAPAIGADSVAEVEAYLDAVGPVRARCDALAELVADTNLAPLESLAPPASPPAIAQGTQLLLDWQTAAVPSTRRSRYAAAAGLVLLTAAGLTAGLSLERTWGWWLASAAVGGLAVLLLWLAAAAWARSRIASRRRESAERYAETGLPQPPTWSSGGVRQSLLLLQSAAAAHRLEDAKSLLRRRLRTELASLAEQSARLEEAGRELNRRCGLAPTAAGATLVEFSRRVGAYHAARQAYEGAAGRVAELKRRSDAELALFQEFLDGYAGVRDAAPDRVAAAANGDGDAEPPPAADNASPAVRDLEAAAAGLRDLQRRVDAHRRASETLADARDHRGRTEADLAVLDRKQVAIYERLRLAPGDEEGLARLAGQLTGYRELATEKERLERDRTRLRAESARLHAAVEPEADGLPAVSAAQLNLAQLDDRIARDTALASRVDALRDRVARIDERVRQARGGALLAEALADRTAAGERLAECRATAVEAALGRSLLAAVGGEHEMTSRPPLLERTAELLRTFTHDRYDLTVVTDGDGASFRVTETTSGRGLTLEQLSAGTRAQLLLAARLAYLLAAETDEALPLFLDEALTAADPERFAAVATGLAAIAAADGRQIFYLTSDPADLARWQAALSSAGQPAPAVVDLGALRGAAAAAEPVTLALPAQRSVPSSAGCNPVDYGRRIGVPRFDPYATAGALHLFYLLRDRLDLLESLLRRDILYLGQWRGSSSRRRSDLAAADVLLLDARGEAAAAFLAAWRHGRGRPVDRQALVDSGAVSARFAEEVAALNRAVDGDAEALLAALEAGRVKGFRREKIRALGHDLTERGYRDPRPVLDRETLHERVLRALADRLDRGELTADAVAELVAVLWATVTGPDDA